MVRLEEPFPPPTPVFAEVLILKLVKALCLERISQVLILKELEKSSVCMDATGEGVAPGCFL